MSAPTPPAPTPPVPGARPTRQDLLRALTRPRAGRRQVAVAVLCGLLAFAVVTQVHSNAGTNALASARQDDLVGILNDLAARGDRLRGEIADLQATERQLASGTGQTTAALDAARQRAQTLGILAGTLPAAGPGIVLTVTDPKGSVHADVLVDALQELRNAGAEAIQLGPVRVVASTYLTDAPGGGIIADGTLLSPPYRFFAIGDPRTLAAAMAIPGGVLDTVDRQSAAHAAVAQTQALTIRVLRPLSQARYARPAQSGG